MTNCSVNALSYNGTLCACDPGYFRAPDSAECVLFSANSFPWRSDSGYVSDKALRSSIFSFNTLNDFTQAQALFLELTTAVVILWLVFCISLRFGPLRDGRSRWFRLRYLLSRLDVFFSTRHWLDEQKIVVKRRTELGGMFSVASSLFFVGLSAALIFQIVSKRSIEMQNIRPANAPDLEPFINDLEFNITTVSSMNCIQLRGLGTLKTGIEGSIEERNLPLGDFMDYKCYNTSTGPKVRFRCNRCLLSRDNYYIPWHFIDMPSNPAAAVGFLFNVTATKDEHVSVLSGAINATMTGSPSTLRGGAENVLEFRLVPRLFRRVHNLSLIQAFFHEFIPGSPYRTETAYQSSLINPKDGLVNITFHLNFLSDYIVEIDKQDIMGPVTFLGNLGGLYAISIALFYYILVQFEYRVKRLRYEDYTLRRLEAHQRAQKNWDKLRRYVIYTWCSNNLDEAKYEKYVDTRASRSMSTDEQHKHKFQKASGERSQSSEISIKTVGTARHSRKRDPVNTERLPPWLSRKDCLPLVPEVPADHEMDVLALQTYTKRLYEYNVRVREDFLAAQSVLADVVQRLSPHSDICWQYVST